MWIHVAFWCPPEKSNIYMDINIPFRFRIFKESFYRAGTFDIWYHIVFAINGKCPIPADVNLNV